jgi:hypothetical protein
MKYLAMGMKRMISAVPVMTLHTRTVVRHIRAMTVVSAPNGNGMPFFKQQKWNLTTLMGKHSMNITGICPEDRFRYRTPVSAGLWQVTEEVVRHIIGWLLVSKLLGSDTQPQPVRKPA